LKEINTINNNLSTIHREVKLKPYPFIIYEHGKTYYLDSCQLEDLKKQYKRKSRLEGLNGRRWERVKPKK
jgi:hypothetical protein